MKRINSFFILFFTLFLIGAKMDNDARVYSRKDCKIELSATYTNENIALDMKFTNVSNDAIRIPFFLFPSDTKDFFGDWFEIIDEDDEIVNYEGIQADIDYDPKHENSLILKPNENYTISLACLRKYYKLMKGEVYTIQYLGPLGESNVAKLKLE